MDATIVKFTVTVRAQKMDLEPGGRSKGRMTTKILALTDSWGLTPGA